MPRKAQSDEDNERKLKPKEQFRLVVGVYDNGYIDYEFVEYYLNEETGKRKKLMYDKASAFKKAIKDNLGDDTDKIAAWVLDGLDIEPNAYARRVCDLPQTYEEEEYEVALERIEETEDAKGGENLP